MDSITDNVLQGDEIVLGYDEQSQKFKKYSIGPIAIVSSVIHIRVRYTL